MKTAIRNPKSAIGFTLVELLVVVAIIVVLLALLLPGMEKAVGAAERAKCAANLHGVSHAIFLYHNDSKRRYPGIQNAALLMGNLGTNPIFSVDASGRQYDTHERPLNAYLGFTGPGTKVPIARCPGDLGDPHPGVNVPNAYEAWGNSYMAMVNVNYRFSAVFAPSIPTRQSSLNPPHNKVLMADWPVHGNRLWSYPGSRWHDKGDPDMRQFNTLFADFHVEWFGYEVRNMDDGYVGDDGQTNLWAAPNPSFKWW